MYMYASGSKIKNHRYIHHDQGQGSLIYASWKNASGIHASQNRNMDKSIMDTCIMDTCIMDTCIINTCIIDTSIMIPAL